MSELQFERMAESRAGEVLRACCTLKLPVTVVVPETGASIRGRFLSADEGTVVIEVADAGGMEFGALANCLVTYVHEERVRVFLSVLQRAEVGRGTDKPKLVLTQPACILQPELRRWFRVPVMDRNAVDVKFESGGYEYGEPAVLDLSLGGMLLEFTGDQDPGIAPDTPVRVELQMEDKVVKYLAEVRYAHDHRYGLMFVPDADVMEAAGAENVLRDILSRLSAMWTGS